MPDPVCEAKIIDVMVLPVVSVSDSSPTLLRLFYQSEQRWVSHLGEAQAMEVGTAYANSQLSSVSIANALFDVRLPPGMSPTQAVDAVEAHYAGRNASCRQWVMSPSVPQVQTQLLVEHLLGLGYEQVIGDVLILRQHGEPEALVRPGLQVIPARAGYRHVRALIEQAAEEAPKPQAVEAGLLHLDDPHFDALLMLRGGQPVAYGGLLTVGEVGRIDDVYVVRDARGQGLGRLLMNHLLDIGRRAQLRHVMLGVPPENAPAQAMCSGLGFVKMGQIVRYRRPA